MADNRKIVSLENALHKAYQQWDALFNQLNQDIAYASWSPEDNPKGNVTNRQWEEYLKDINVVRDSFGHMGMAIYRLSQLQKHAKPQRQRS